MIGLLLFIQTLCLSVPTVSSLHKDEAGVNEYVLNTAGHGQVGVKYARLATTTHSDDGELVWITSQSNDHPGSIRDGSPDVESSCDASGSFGADADPCYVSARNVSTGELLWRASACANIDGAQTKDSRYNPRHATLASVYLSVFTLDDTAVFRAWSNGNGKLLADADVFAALERDDLSFPQGVPRLLDSQTAIATVVQEDGVADDESLVFLENGVPVYEAGNPGEDTPALISAKMLLNKAGVKSTKLYKHARIVDITSLDDDLLSQSPRVAVWVAWSSENEEGQVLTTLGQFAYVQVVLTHRANDDGQLHKIYQVTAVADAVKSSSATPLLLSTLRMVHHSPMLTSLLAVSSSREQLLVEVVDIAKKRFVERTVEIDGLHPYFRSIDSIHVDNTNAAVGSHSSAGAGPYHVIRVAGLDDRYPRVPRRFESLFFLNGNGEVNPNTFYRLTNGAKGGDEVHHDGIAYCSEMGMLVTAMRDEVESGQTVATAHRVLSTAHTNKRIVHIDQKVYGDRVITADGDYVNYAHLGSCSKQKMTVIFNTVGGLTTTVDYVFINNKLRGLKRWQSEEALGSISSAFFLDEQHAAVKEAVDGDDEEELALLRLDYSSRMQSQISSFKSFILEGGAISSLMSLAVVSGEKKLERDIAFGFAKISVMLSESLHRVVALDTASKGRVVWSRTLHPGAAWHRLVHGGQFISVNDPHGNGGVNDHEVLSISYVEKGGVSSHIEWSCFDGLTGKEFSRQVDEISKAPVQVVPLRSSSHHHHDSSKSCRQVALLVHSDKTITVVPDTARSYAIVDEALAASENGLYVHHLDKSTGAFEALLVRKDRSAGHESDSFKLVTVGTTLFDPKQEKIINVVYPRRGEVIQSPTTVLGDDALLLKYLNPNLIVVVSEATPEFSSNVAYHEGSDVTTDAFFNALHSVGAVAGQKRKPVGASAPGAEVPASLSSPLAPTLFVSLVDSASGRILHRASHSHALAPGLASGKKARVPAVISENWVVYSFFNQRTRRTDVGVLTLHEGMIDKKGITMFRSPDQEQTFSSLESSKPIVLSKVYSMPKPVTSIGVTTTKAGISSKQFLFATGSDQVVSLDRRMLDPRRPNGELKESEKMEGLMRYSPLLPIIPLRTPSHVYEVSSVKGITSSAANVESQSLVIAHGGADIFFARLAPSKGFDLLPDDFNRLLLSIVLVGLIVLLHVIQRMNKKKMVVSNWS